MTIYYILLLLLFLLDLIIIRLVYLLSIHCIYFKLIMMFIFIFVHKECVHLGILLDISILHCLMKHIFNNFICYHYSRLYNFYAT